MSVREFLDWVGWGGERFTLNTGGTIAWALILGMTGVLGIDRGPRHGLRSSAWAGFLGMVWVPRDGLESLSTYKKEKLRDECQPTFTSLHPDGDRSVTCYLTSLLSTWHLCPHLISVSTLSVCEHTQCPCPHSVSVSTLAQ